MNKTLEEIENGATFYIAGGEVPGGPYKLSRDGIFTTEDDTMPILKLVYQCEYCGKWCSTDLTPACLHEKHCPENPKNKKEGNNKCQKKRLLNWKS